MQKNVQFKAPLVKLLSLRNHTSFHSENAKYFSEIVRSASEEHLKKHISSFIMKNYRMGVYGFDTPTVLKGDKKGVFFNVYCRKPLHRPSSATSHDLVYFYDTTFEYFTIKVYALDYEEEYENSSSV
jgi:hypothetical protein